MSEIIEAAMDLGSRKGCSVTGRRVHERFDRRLDMVVHHEGGEIHCESLNISLGGVYLISTETLPYGTPVHLEVKLAALKEPTRIEGVVRWQKDDGMGVQFGSLRAREVWALNELFEEG